MQNLSPKKSEVIELRLPYETKTAFMTRVRQEGTTASAVLRRYIDRYLEGSAEPRHVFGLKETPMTLQIQNDPATGRRWRPALAAFTTLLGLGAVVLAISPANAVPDLAGAFRHLDVDGDGILTEAEFSGAIAGGTAPLTAAPGQQVTKPLEVMPSGDNVVFLVGQPPTGPSTGFIATIPQTQVPIDRFVGDAMREEFARLDADSDSLVSFGEFAARHGTVMTRLFEVIDKNRDDFADATELGIANVDGSTPAEFINAMDANADGRLSRLEFAGRQ